MEEDIGVGDVLEWYEDDEMVRQWEEASKEEEKIAKGKFEGKSLQVEGVQGAPELQISQVLAKEKEQKKSSKRRRRRKVRR